MHFTRDVFLPRRGACVLPQLCMAFAALSQTAVAVDHVIHVSFDGLRGDLLEENINASPADHPTFGRLVAEGAATFNARTDYSNAETLPNHASMLTGRPVDQPSGAPSTTHHGYTENGTPPPGATLHNAGNPNLSYVASTFDVVHDHGLSTAFYASKAKLEIFKQSYSATTGGIDVTGVDNGRDKIDSDFVSSNFALMHVDYLSDMAANQYSYSLVHYGYLDGVGHNMGWGSSAWNDALELMDQFLGEVLEMVETNPGLASDTAIIVTADHGGLGTGHGDPSVRENYTIPVLVWGPGVAPGADLYDLNPISRVDPGFGQPSYAATTQPIRDGDTGNLALDLLGLGPIDGSTINAGQDLAVASAFDADFDGNQRVDGEDVRIWQAGYGMPAGVTKAFGDANLDGAANGLDFLRWQHEHGSSLVSTGSAVPEPSGMPLIFLAIVCLHQGLTGRRALTN